MARQLSPKRGISAGQLNRRLTIQTPTETRDAAGGVVRTWATHATIWGAVENLRGAETKQGPAVSPLYTHKITIRYLSTLTVDMRIVDGARTINIGAILPDPKCAWYQVILGRQA